MNDQKLLRQAIEQARVARDRGDDPFGAVLADGTGRVLAEAGNTVVTDRDPTGHAETNLVRAAGRKFGSDDLAVSTLYASTEPCAMCSAAIYWSGIGAIVYDLGQDTLVGIAGDGMAIPQLVLGCRTVLAAGGRPVTVRGPFDSAAARDVHADFWR